VNLRERINTVTNYWNLGLYFRYFARIWWLRLNSLYQLILREISITNTQNPFFDVSQYSICVCVYSNSVSFLIFRLFELFFNIFFRSLLRIYRSHCQACLHFYWLWDLKSKHNVSNGIMYHTLIEFVVHCVSPKNVDFSCIKKIKKTCSHVWMYAVIWWFTYQQMMSKIMKMMFRITTFFDKTTFHSKLWWE